MLLHIIVFHSLNLSLKIAFRELTAKVSGDIDANIAIKLFARESELFYLKTLINMDNILNIPTLRENFEK